MSGTLPTMSEETISGWVGSRSFQLSRRYLENDAIFDLRRRGSTLSACCQGSMLQPYRLRVAFGAEGVEEADCSCPVGSGGHCKHVGALLLAWLEQPDAFRVAAELDADLEQRSKGELIALIKQMLQFQPDLEILLEMALSGGDEQRTTVNPETYRRQVSTAFRRGGDEWMASFGIATDVDATMRIGDGFQAVDDYVNASVVYQAVAEGVMEHYEMVLDEDGHLGEVVERCVEGLGRCLADGGDDIGTVRGNALQTLFSIYRLDLDLGGVGLGEAVPGLILEHATGEEKRTVAGWVRAAMPRSDGESDNFERQMYGHFLLGLEMDELDDASFLSICRESGLVTDLVDRLLTLGRLDEALTEAAPADDYELLMSAEVFRRHGCVQQVEPLLAKRIETSRDHRLVEWLKDRHEERGELAEALTLARLLLRRHPRLSGYLEARELSQQLGTWQELRPQLLAEWSAAREHGLLTDIYLEEGEIDLALRSAEQGDRGFLYGAHRLLRVVEAASKTRPHAAVDIYRRELEGLIAARGRDNYRRACEHLLQVRDLYRQMSQEPEWTRYIAELRERHRRLPALTDELSKARL